jgi:uncharacterized DUF497 family protein
MRFEWDETKSRHNIRKHRVAFETAALVFEDSCAISRRDCAFDDEERWITVGALPSGSILFVVHMFYEQGDEEIVRIISARLAELHERKAYEEAYQAAKGRHARPRRNERRRH